MFKLQSSNEQISYTLVLLINHDGDSLDCGHYVSDVFDSSTGIWWHCDDDNITEVSDLPERVYYRETHKPTKKGFNDGFLKGTVCCFYQNKPFDETQLYFFRRIQTFVQNYYHEKKVMIKMCLEVKLWLENKLMMKYKELFLILKTSFNFPLKKTVREGRTNEKLYWLHADGLKLLLTMNPMEKLKIQ